MASTAQIKSQRQVQARRIRAEVRRLDSLQETLQRRIISMTRKRKMIEADDIPILSAMYRTMANQMTTVEREIINLGRLTNN